jgi:hypothetical protein
MADFASGLGGRMPHVPRFRRRVTDLAAGLRSCVADLAPGFRDSVPALAAGLGNGVACLAPGFGDGMAGLGGGLRRALADRLRGQGGDEPGDGQRSGSQRQTVEHGSFSCQTRV